jgi:hypothetical protein
MKLLEQLLSATRPVRDAFPLTTGGVALVVGAYWVFSAYGRDQSDMVLYAAGALAMAFVVLSLLCVLVGSGLAVLLSSRGSDEEAQVNTGDQVETGFSVPNVGLWPVVEVAVWWDKPADVDVRWVPKGARLIEWISPRSRGHIRHISRRYMVRDIFGLASLSFSATGLLRLKVAPQAAQVDLSVALRDVSGDGYSHPVGQPEGELIEMRRYSPGDPLRLVLWKTFARTRRLLVRVPERAVMPQRSSVAVMIAGPEDEASASVARTFMEQGLLGADYQFFADGEEQPARDLGACVDRLVRSAHAREQSGEVLVRLLAQVDKAQLANCVVFVPAAPGPWVERLHAFAQQVPTPPSVIIGVDGELTQPAPVTWRRWLQREPPRAENKALRALPALYDQLASVGGPVRMLHRGDGQLIDDVALDGLRSLV